MAAGTGSGPEPRFSAPIAAGVAALCPAVNPSLSNAALVALLERTADDLRVAGYDPSFGWGRIDAYRAVLAAMPVVAPTVRQNPERRGER